ncbi:pilus assembly protein TadG-related protein [Microbacterium hibisci]|uniref:pilus assembly protein TadG-related protein n=1 Tax=Microbacterium hibisci TaxID=2036000 RepID=UPI001941B88D|nr:pilus assembly protein TadG-related protein [Microbacterium hibisci]
MNRRLKALLGRRHGADDEGSVLLLTLGYGVLAIAVILVCTAATSLYLAQKQLDAVADAAALAAADGFELSVVDGEPVATLTSDGVRREAEAMVGAVATDARLISATTPDGVSARVTVAGSWHPPVVTMFVPDGVALEATATSRTALR